MQISRMDLADFGSAEQIVQGILDQAPDIPIPVPVEQIARMLDITDIRPLEMEGFEGGLITDRDKSQGVILVNHASPRQRRRFSIGHELGHFLCPTHVPKDDAGFRCTPANMRQAFAPRTDRAAQMEVEANRFSALLLLPLPHFRKMIRKRSSADIRHIIELARDYDVSKEATARRYVEIHDEPCAVIVSRHGRVLRFYRGQGFPFIDLKFNGPVPAKSLTARADLTEGVASDWNEADAALWLPSEPGRRLPVVYEQVLPQREGFRLTLLTIESADEEAQEDEDQELEESWTARFHR